MPEFDREKMGIFLGAVRKYMQVRGPLSQKDLAEMTGIGVSTMSRFLNGQTKEVNPQLIAHITAKLNIPLHEVIDFVDESYTEQFIRLVKFYRDDETGAPPPQEVTGENEDDLVSEALSGTQGGGSERTTTAHIKVGGRTRPLHYQAEGSGSQVGKGDLREKLRNLSLKQKGFLNEFLNLDSDGRDLVSDVGRNIISYLRQKGIDF